jgi:hypothetical protein
VGSVGCDERLLRGGYREPGQQQQAAFDCGNWAGNAHVARTYSAIFDQLGVEIDRWDQTGLHAHPVATYLNP